MAAISEGAPRAQPSSSPPLPSLQSQDKFEGRFATQMLFFLQMSFIPGAGAGKSSCDLHPAPRSRRSRDNAAFRNAPPPP